MFHFTLFYISHTSSVFACFWITVLGKGDIQLNMFSYSSTKTYVVGIH